MRQVAIATVMILGSYGCDGSTGGTGGTTSVPTPYMAVHNVLSMTADATNVIIHTNDLPDHKSPFYGKTSPNYEAYNGTNPNFSTAINLMGMISDPILAS